LALLLEEKEKRRRRRKLLDMYPDEGPLRRELYARHMEFFRLGKIHRERLFMAANRVGKTEGAGGFELALHLTGLYPPWWEGRTFDGPISAWTAGTTNQTTRDILQAKLCGRGDAVGTGLIPGDRIVTTYKKSGSADAYEFITVEHVSGGLSRLGFKTYEQGRKAFEGTEQHVILLDEEPTMAIYTECLTRTMTTRGLVMVTFTPLQGISAVVLSFLPEGRVAHE